MSGPLKNQRHERFAQELAKGKTSDEAYAQAGFKANRGNASTLKAKQNVADRVAEIQGRGAAKAEVTVESLIGEAEQARRLAMDLEQPAAAVSAIAAKGKLAGLWVEKRENLNKNVDPNTLPDGELADIAIRGRVDPVASEDRPAKPH